MVVVVVVVVVVMVLVVLKLTHEMRFSTQRPLSWLLARAHSLARSLLVGLSARLLARSFACPVGCSFSYSVRKAWQQADSRRPVKIEVRAD